MIEHFQLKLADSRMLAPTVRHLALERADGTPFKFTPGQFVQIHFNYDDGKPTKRSYSVGTPAEGDEVDKLELAISYVEGGAATRLLGNLERGGSVEASGPYGRFCLMDDDANRRYFLIATGTGVTPYRAMLPKIKKLIAERGTRVALLYGARNEEELLYGEEFEASRKNTRNSRSMPVCRAQHARHRARTIAAATCRRCCPNCSPTPNTTSRIYAAIPK